jgi:hypothetical protein
MGSATIAFTGADFCFAANKQFHPWKSKYDGTLGNAIRTVDIYGNKALTWASYYNFKCWFEHTATAAPGFYVNASEGGIFGAYIEGNIQQVIQMPLKYFIDMYFLHDHIKGQIDNPESGVDPEINEIKILF